METVLTSAKKAVWTDASYWRNLACGTLTIDDSDNKNNNDATHGVNAPEISEKEGTRRRQRLVEDGYVLVDDRIDVELAERLTEVVTTMHRKYGYPATFILLYDEVWEIARVARQIMGASIHASNEFNFDVLAWFIDPSEHSAGFSPHRDRQPATVADSFHKDKQAKYVTMWMALADATPENSCLYVIPKPFDPGYTNGDEDQDPMARALSTKQSFQYIRALPRQAGQSVLFTHRIMHWGSRGNPEASPNKPRVAISFVASDPEFERPYVSSDYFTQDKNPPFHIRLLIVCSQLLIYHERFDLPKECVRACYEYCKEHSNELDEAYRQKVFVEFVKAMREATDRDDKQDSATVGENSAEAENHLENDTDGDDKDEDAMLEEMLDAEAGGYGEFGDDYDEVASNDGEAENTTSKEDDSEGEEESEIIFGIDSQPDSKKRKT